MLKNTNYGKILVVAFITILIWVWADLAQDEELSISNTTISIAKSANPDLWVSFNNESATAIDKIVLKGPASRIADIKRKLNDGSLTIEFFLDPEQLTTITGPQYLLNLLEFLRRGDQIRQLGLTVKSCEPGVLNVQVAKLVKKLLNVMCVDNDNIPVKTTIIEPPQVNMFVPEDWMGEKLVANVSLNRGEISQARLSPIEKKPYIELAQGQFRESPIAVKITTPPEEDSLRPDQITAARLGITLSANLQGKYEVELTNLDTVMSAIAIRATPQAKRAYENMRYQVILEIDDSDKDIGFAEPLRKELIYNFPAEYVRKDEIVLNQQPVIARFTLIPLPDIELQSSP